MAISLWMARLDRDLTEVETEQLRELLPFERRMRVDHMRMQEKCREPLCAYALLTMALRERFGWDRIPEIAFLKNGKPYFPEFQQCFFNISHTNGAVMVGLAEHPIGVDIEKIHEVSPRIMQKIVPGGEENFFSVWVRREARTKRTGIGITEMMRTEPQIRKNEQYWPVDAFQGYAAGLAGDSCESVSEVHRYTLDELMQKLEKYRTTLNR